MKFCEGTIIIKELQRLYFYFSDYLKPTNVKIWLSADAYKGISQALNLKESNRLEILNILCDRQFLPEDFVERVFSIDTVKKIGITFPDIIYFFKKNGFNCLVGEEIKQRADKNAISQILSFRPYVNLSYGIMPNIYNELIEIFNELGIGLIEILNPEKITPLNKANRSWMIHVEPKSAMRFEKFNITISKYLNTLEVISSKEKKFETKNPLLCNYERKNQLPGIIAVLQHFSHINKNLSREYLISQIKDHTIINELDNILNLLNKIGITKKFAKTITLAGDRKDEILELNYLLQQDHITEDVYKQLIVLILRRYIISNPIIKKLILKIKALGGEADMVNLFKEIGKEDLFLLLNTFTNGRSPCGVLYEKPDICKGCKKNRKCAEYLAKNGIDKFHEIWFSPNSSGGQGIALDFFKTILNEDMEKFEKYVSDEKLFPLFVKFAIARQLNFGKALLAKLKILEEDTKNRDKARGNYCPWEDIWTLNKTFFFQQLA
ncbi:MAG: hypothetical protein ACTSPW_15895 [Promethearchaeota archaeon]